MLIELNAKQYTSGAEVIAGHKASRHRLFNPPFSMEAMNKLKEAYAVEMERSRRLAATVAEHEATISDLQQQRNDMAEKIENLEFILRELEPQAVEKRQPLAIAVDILKRKYPEISLEEIRGSSRVPHLIKPRHEIWAAVHRERPDISISKIGRLFNRDHSTILFSFKKAKEEAAS